MTNNLQNKQEIQEIDLLKLLKVLWNKIWIIVSAAFVGGVAFFVFTFFFITPQYQSTALLYVNNSSLDIGSTKLNITSGDINASSSLIATYSVILRSRTTLEQAIAEGITKFEFDGEYNWKYLAGYAREEADTIWRHTWYKIMQEARDKYGIKGGVSRPTAIKASTSRSIP